jgi:hypothetical protein
MNMPLLLLIALSDFSSIFMLASFHYVRYKTSKINLMDCYLKFWIHGIHSYPWRSLKRDRELVALYALEFQSYYAASTPLYERQLHER